MQDPTTEWYQEATDSRLLDSIDEIYNARYEPEMLTVHEASRLDGLLLEGMTEAKRRGLYS